MAQTGGKSTGRGSPEKPGALQFNEIFRRRSWKPLPAVAVLAGEAAFLRRQIERRFIRELFGDHPTPEITRHDGSEAQEGLLARVLDDLRTLSILSPVRLVIVQPADGFLSAHRDDLEPFIESGFAGGHLLLHLERPADEKLRFTRAAIAGGWVVTCRQPFDRPPPWRGHLSPWENDLSRWIVSWARLRNLEIDLRTAFLLQERVGTDLSVLDECLEKMRTFLGERSNRVDPGVVERVTGEIRDDSVFDLVEAFIGARRSTALRLAERLFERGYHPSRGSPVYEATAITSLFIGALLSRLRPLRRAHALKAAGEGPDRWIALRLIARPFIDRFRRELAAMPPRRIEGTLAALLKLDREMKTGSDARLGLALLLARN